MPDAPSSITRFFLYEKDIDVEILNDPSGRIIFTTYAGGRKTNNVEKDLSFDPTTDFTSTASISTRTGRSFSWTAS